MTEQDRIAELEAQVEALRTVLAKRVISVSEQLNDEMTDLRGRIARAIPVLLDPDERSGTRVIVAHQILTHANDEETP